MVSVLLYPKVIEAPQYEYIGETMGDKIAKELGIPNTRQLQHLALDVRAAFYFPHVALKPVEDLIPQLRPIWEIVNQAVQQKPKITSNTPTLGNSQLSEIAAVTFIVDVLKKLKGQDPGAYGVIIDYIEQGGQQPGGQGGGIIEEPGQGGQKRGQGGQGGGIIEEPGQVGQPGRQGGGQGGQKRGQGGGQGGQKRGQGGGQGGRGEEKEWSKIQEEIKKVSKSAAEDTRNKIDLYKDAEEIIEGVIGGTGAGKYAGKHGRVSPEQVSKLVSNTEVSELIEYMAKTKIAGEVLKEASRRKSSFTQPGMSGIKKIEKESEIERILPSEFVYPEEEFIRRFVERGLNVYERPPEASGLIYVLIDISGSMGGEKILWAKALATALLIKARTLHYKFCYRAFEHQVLPLHCTPPEDPVKVFTDIASIEASGGTDITNAILTGLQDISPMRGLVEKTIFIITDGEDEVPQDLVKQSLIKNKTRLVSVMVQGDNPSLRAVSKAYFKAKFNAGGILTVMKVV